MSDDVARYGVAIDSSAAEQGRDKTVRAFKDIVVAAGAAGEAERNRQAIFAKDQSVEYVRGLAQASTEAGRRMALLELEARKLDEAMLANVASNQSAASAVMGHGLQLGRLRMELGTLVGRLTGTSTAMDRMVGAIGGMAVGDPIVIAALAGIAAIGAGYEYLTKAARDAEKQNAELIKGIVDGIRKAQEAMGDLQVAAAKLKVADAEAALASARMDASASGGSKAGDSGYADVQAKKAADALDHANNILGAALQKKTEIDFKMEFEAKRSSDEFLATVISGNTATAAERARALAQYKAYGDEIERLTQSQTDNVRRAFDIQERDKLKAALFPKAGLSDEHKHDGELRALAQMLALDEHRLEAAKALDQAASHGRAEYEKVLHTQAIERDILVEQHQILMQHLDTNGKIRKGEEDQVRAEQTAAAVRLHEIDALQQSAKAKLEFDAKATEARKLWARELAQAEKAFADEQQRVAKTIENDLLHAVEAFTTHGLNDFRSFFAEVERLSLQMVSHLNDALSKDGAMFARAMEDSDMVSAQMISDQMHQLEQLRRIAAPVAAGIAVATTGYQIGQSTGSTTMGAIGGAASGAMAGSAFGGPGMAIGAFVGLAAGILGAGHAAAEAAKRMHELQVAVALSMAALHAEVNHDMLGAGIASVNADREQRRKAIEEAYSGGGADSEQVRKRMAALYEMNGLEDQRVQQLRDESALTLTRLNEDVSVQIARNHGDTVHADAMAAAVDQERRFADLRKQGIDDATISALALSEAAKASADAAIAARQANRDLEDLNVRMLAAQGHAQASSDAAFRNQQQREYQDAQAASRSPEYLALLTAVQVQEAIQRATQIEIDRQTALIQEGNKQQQLAFDAQIKAAQDTLKTNQEQLRTAERSVQALQRVVDNLKNFRDSLALSNLSPLSPTEQLAEAKRQLDSVYAKANGGDIQAGSDFENIAKAFLTASRDVNASGSGYASDFAAVQQMTDALQGKFGPQLTAQQQIVAQLTAANTALQAQIDATTAARDAAQKSADAAIAALQAVQTQSTAQVLAALEKNRTAVLQPADSLLASLEAVRTTVDAAGRATLAGEQAALLESRNAAAAASAAQITAVREGRDAATIQQLATISELQAARLAANTNATRVEAELIKSGALGQSEIDALIANRQAANDAAVAAINAVREGRDAATQQSLAQIAELQQHRLQAYANATQLIGQLTQSGALGQEAIDTLRGNRAAADAAAAAAVAAVRDGTSAAVQANLAQIAKLEQNRLDMNGAAYQQEAALAAQRAVLDQQVTEARTSQALQAAQTDQITSQRDALVRSLGSLDTASATRAQAQIDAYNLQLAEIAKVKAVNDAHLAQMVSDRTVLDAQLAKAEEQRKQADDQAKAQIAVLAAIRDKDWTPTIVYVPPTPNPGGNNGDDQGRPRGGGRIPQLASGGYFGGGIRLVGERGPELEFTGPSQIVSANQTSSMLADALGQSAAMAAELRDLNDSSAATVAVLQAGLSALVRRVEELAARVEENTRVTKRGFEAMS